MKQGWEIKKLGEISDFQGGSQPPKEEWISEPKNGYVRMLQIRDFTKNNSLNIEYVKKSNRLKYCKEDDILIGRYGASVGKILTGLAGAYNVAIIKTIPNETLINKSFFRHFLYAHSFQEFLQHVSKMRAAQAGFSKEDIQEYQIPVPPLSEQERIVAELDLLSDVIAKKREQLKQLDTLAQSIFYDMFGDPITNEKGWEQVSLVDICKNTGVYGAGSSSIPKQPHRPRYIRITDILDSGDLNDDFVVSSNIEDDHTYRLNVGDILFARSGATVGKTYLYRGNEAQIYAGYLIKFSLNILYVNPIFIFYITKNRSYKLWISKQIIGVAQPNINAQKYGKLPIILPPLALQQQFASMIESIEKQKELIKQSLSEVQQLFDSRMDYYFG